jgi:phosphate transport system permease protein
MSDSQSHLTRREPTSALRHRRRRTNRVVTAGVWLLGVAALLPLVALFGYVVFQGVGQLTPSLVFRVPAAPGARGGGMANALVGSAILVTIALAIAVPVGVGGGLFLADQPDRRLARVVRLLTDVLGGLPSIVMGIVAWELIVRPSGHFSGWAGGVALGLLVVPLVTRATEEMVRLVPRSLTEAGLALGLSKSRTAMTIVLRTALPGVTTAVLVALARVAGETAPLLFTAFGNPFWSVDPARPIAAIPLQIYAYAQSPFDEWNAQAWASALLLVLMVAALGVGARLVRDARARLLAAVRLRRGRDAR